MCSCGKSTSGGVKKFTHTYTLDGQKKTETHDSEMEARQAASRLGGSVRPA